MAKLPKTSLNPVLGLVTALFISLVGMVSVYLAGNARGYDPSLTILVRNLFLMAFFFVIYALLKKNYRGDFSILVVVALLTSVGFTIQYRISSAINVDFQKTLVKQYSAAAAKKIEADSLQTESGAKDSLSVAASRERSLQAIQEEGKQLLRLDKFKFGQMLRELIDSAPGWSRLIISYIFALMMLVYLVKKCAKNSFMDELSRPFFWITVTIFMLMVFVALSEVKTRGRFVYQMTPWEAFKVTIIIFLAGFFAKYKEAFVKKTPRIKGKRLQQFLVPWGPFILIWFIPQLLFVLLKDFGQVIIYGGLVVIMLFVTTRKYIYLLGGIAITAITSRAILLLEGIAPAHVLQRFLIWSDIWRLPHDINWWDNVYQIMNSFFALHAGSWTGAGLGLGYPTNIPLVVSDFVYSAIAEEIGFIGSGIIVLLYLMLIFLGLRVVRESETDFEKLLAVGFTSILGIQVFVNIGGVIKLIPLTGITLPFISRGGFSFLISLILVGFLMGLSHRNGMKGTS